MSHISRNRDTDNDNKRRDDSTQKRREPEKKCSPKFVNGTNQANPDCDPKVRILNNRCEGTIYKIIFPGSQYDSAGGRKLADAEIKRATNYYAKYCIDLTVEEITIPAKTAKILKDAYAIWFDEVVTQVGGKDHLGKTSISKENRANFHKFIEKIQELAEEDVKPKGKKLVVVFMDEYIGGADGRDTLISSCQEDIHQIGINWIDRGSPYILAHELIHALGKPSTNKVGAVTWPHSSNCNNALSKVPRTDARSTVDLSGRFLDVEEYLEIGKNRGAKILKCHKIK